MTDQSQWPTIDVAMRCRNEMPFATDALEALTRQQGVKARVLFIDCESTDGSREAAEQAQVRILDFDPKAYIPGRVLNLAMEETETDVVAFINADAIAMDEHALLRLVEPLLGEDPAAAATYARQIPREQADDWTKLDYRRAFGERDAVDTRVGTFFSMAASAIHRDVWKALPFDAELRYSEDVDWTNRITTLGHVVQYVPDAVFEHSHDYTIKAHFKRRRGEGRADSAIYRLGNPSIVSDCVRPWAGSLLRDTRAGLLTPKGVAIRTAQALGYFMGRRDPNW